jgi:tRNA threonylcarbamoyladenosine biosynthesis protein TsaB
MEYLLIIETSAEVCSVALTTKSEVVAELNSETKNSHSELLAGFAKEILEQNNVSWSNIIAIAINGGPGSYTGLRIGASLAKGICFARKIPLIAVNSLQIIASTASPLENQKICSLIDARRMNVYFAIFDNNGNTLVQNGFTTLSCDFLIENNLKETDIFVGSGAEKLNQLYNNQLNIAEGTITARDAHILAWKKYEKQEFESVAYYEPNYIKAVHITKKKETKV